jgi:hypothetical protein
LFTQLFILLHLLSLPVVYLVVYFATTTYSTLPVVYSVISFATPTFPIAYSVIYFATTTYKQRAKKVGVAK